ncbi:uncharacterized protein LOC110704060 [Chenopodium quinoa]|uniref:uncharacterized protein LOC110704060 n=1 Tax=Chenopodium quinoa TaxID=63459 RepID=UPI000B77287F|nr:uncharacterized protein LOC110704060 [Chenopodium quinoa]
MYLKDEADIWWRDNAVTVRAKPNFGWEVFKTSLRDKFYPPFLKKQKAQEFISLAMGDMSISEYYNKFMTISRFAPKVVPTEELKAQRSGSASAKAGEKRKDFGKSENQSNFKRPRNGNSLDRGNQNVRISSNSNNGEITYHCKRCRRNHPGRDCDGNLVTCRFCNKRGHREYECYTKQKQQGNGGNGGNTQQRANNFKNQGNRGNGNNNNGYQARNNTRGLLSMMSKGEDERSSDVVTGTFSIQSVSVNTLFDSGAAYSFISTSVVHKLNLT